MGDGRWEQKSAGDIIKDMVMVKEQIANQKTVFYSEDSMVRAGFIPKKHELGFMKDCLCCCFLNSRMCDGIPCFLNHYIVDGSVAEAIERLKIINSIEQTHL